ncbi:hypothetical protein STVA_49810 [Allostella vacuolata]|nr:hypothetical protein STVA_49810 [Stella vacuolata]
MSEDLSFSIPYTNLYFASLAPPVLRFIPLLHRFQAGPAAGSDRFTYAEFGCGQGLSLLVMAAANPNATFYGIDFSPGHIARARRMADEAGLGNVVLLERAFEDMQPDDLPPLDFAVMHGVYSWIGPETRAALVGVLDRHVKPGGIVHVSYNTLTTWTNLLPIQKLLSEYAAQASGTPEERANKALDFLETLLASNAGHFREAKALAGWLKHTRSGDIRYVLHEYFVRHWEPTPHSTVAAHMEGAKLSFVGTCDVIDSIDRYVMAPEVAKIVAEIPAGPIRETASDLVRNNSFRRDVYVRGPVPMTAAEHQAQMAGTRFALVRRRDQCKLTLKFPVGQVELNAQAFDPLLDHLVQGPATVADLARTVGEKLDAGMIRRIVTLHAAGYIFPCPTADADPAPSERFNRVLGREIAAGHGHAVLASPVLGGGVRLPAPRIAALAGAAPPPAAGTPERAGFEGDREAMARLGVATRAA